MGLGAAWAIYVKIWRVGGDADEKRCPVEELKAGIERMNRGAEREQKEGERRLDMQRANECCRTRTGWQRGPASSAVAISHLARRRHGDWSCWGGGEIATAAPDSAHQAYHDMGYSGHSGWVACVAHPMIAGREIAVDSFWKISYQLRKRQGRSNRSASFGLPGNFRYTASRNLPWGWSPSICRQSGSAVWRRRPRPSPRSSPAGRD